MTSEQFTQVDCDEQRKTKDDLITFFGNDVDLAFETEHTKWHWGHISDLREIPRKNQIGVVVQTPVHETVFPFELTHDTDTPLWKLVESNGGSIQDLRGMDICVRNRSLNLSNDFVRTLNYSRYSKNMYQPNPPRQHNIQSELKKEDSPMYLVDTECSVEPIAVDVNFMWDFGIPPVDRFTKENNLEESDSVLSQQDTESGYLVS